MAIAKEVPIWRGQVRLPKTLADIVKESAKANFRSMNAELVEIVRAATVRDERSLSPRSGA